MLRKCGLVNVRKLRLNNSRKKLSIHFQDLFTSLVEMRWRWIFILFTITNVSSCYLFGVLWWTIAYYHGDLKMLSQYTSIAYNDTDPCIYGIEDLGTSILFSIEVQTTLGFGSRVPSSKCPEAVFILQVQIIFGTLLGSILLGLIFTKVARPMARSKAILFSKKAVVCMRDNRLCILFRVADVRKSKILGANVRAYLFNDYTTQEGEVIRRYQRKLEISVDQAGSDVILSWPLTVCHTITSQSPLFDMTALDMLRSDFEIMISLSGVMETTGQTLEARTSYVPNEIHWGHRFAPMIRKVNEEGRTNYIIDYNKFDVIVPIDTPVCSARQIAEYSDPNSPMNFMFHMDDPPSSKVPSSTFDKGIES
ncbi:ATP-sensitive inward rectifier potassium channel 8-like isoform X2 [Planococcus citri]